MIGTSMLFSSYAFGSGQDKVTIADGLRATVAGCGNIQLNSHHVLTLALHVPSLSISLPLLVVSLVTLSCSVTFFSDHCVFQEIVL